MNSKLGWSKYWFPSIVNPHTRIVQQWNRFFVTSCLFAIFVDPLFFLLFSVNQFRLAYVVAGSCTVGAGELVEDPKRIAHHYLRGWFIFDLFAFFPAPQIITWILISRLNLREVDANFAKNLLRVIMLLQYIPRCIRFIPFAVGSFAFETARANFVINLFIYLLAGHVIGCCWYLFGLERVNLCLHQVCLNETGCQLPFLDCGNGKNIASYITPPRSQWLQSSQASNTCLVPQQPPLFNYGIYVNAVYVTLETKIISKYLYSLCWGFLQLSTMANNLVPSLFVWEVLFTIIVIGSGLLLFALLIGNMQTYLLFLGRRKMDMQLKRRGVETWMKRRTLTSSLRRRVREEERFKWVVTQGVDEENLLKDLSEDLQKDIRHFLYLDYLKKVHLFTVMEDIVLDAICERLRHRFYIKDSIILRPSHPVNRMLFILRGQLESIGDDGFSAIINQGEFCGEELLTWCIENAAMRSNSKKSLVRRTGQRALSSRIVKCTTNVEAFTLEAADLEYVTNNFSRSMRNPRVQGAIRYQSPYWRSWAARRIQTTWKYRQRKLGKSLSMKGEME